MRHLTKHKVNNKTVQVSEYLSAQSLIEDCKDTKGSSKTGRKEFTGTESYEQLNAVFGLTPEANPLVSEMNIETAQGKETKIVNTIKGIHLDFDAFSQDRPDCFFNSVNTDGQGMRNVNLVFNICESGSVDSEVIKKKAAIFTGIVNELTNQGINTQVWLVCYTEMTCHSFDVLMKIKVKDYFQELSDDMLNAFHVGIFRRGYFAFTEKYYPKQVNRGYGRPKSINALSPIQLRELLGLLPTEEIVTFDTISKDDNLKRALFQDDIEYLKNHIEKKIANTFEMINSNY